MYYLRGFPALYLSLGMDLQVSLNNMDFIDIADNLNLDCQDKRAKRDKAEKAENSDKVIAIDIDSDNFHDSFLDNLPDNFFN